MEVYFTVHVGKAHWDASSTPGANPYNLFMVNIASKYPENVKVLSSLLSKQLRTWKALMPVFKSTNKTVPFPDEVIK